MAKERSRQQRIMQDAIDGQLSEETARKLFEVLGRDQTAARDFDRLQRVDSLLKRAPQQRAPARLAAAIWRVWRNGCRLRPLGPICRRKRSR